MSARKPPHNIQVLQRWVGDLARQEGIAPARLQRWISFMVVAGMLDHARDENRDPLFILKGGAALELRLGLRARATKDFDATFRHDILDMIEYLDDALRRGHGDFTATRTELEPIAQTGAQRVDIKLAYRGRSWATVQLEIAVAEGVAGREIDRLPGKPLDARVLKHRRRFRACRCVTRSRRSYMPAPRRLPMGGPTTGSVTSSTCYCYGS